MKGKNKGKKHYNNGIVSIFISGDPPEGFKEGLLRRKKKKLE